MHTRPGNVRNSMSATSEAALGGKMAPERALMETKIMLGMYSEMFAKERLRAYCLEDSGMKAPV